MNKKSEPDQTANRLFFDIPESKQEKKRRLRKILLAERDALSLAERRALDDTLCQKISSLPCFLSASMLLLYDPIGSEANLLPLAKIAETRGVPVGFPVCRSNPKGLIFRQADAQTVFEPGAFGIPVPPESARELTPDENAVCLLPALGYDQTLARLGYGGGYYDRFSVHFPGKKIGVCAERFLCDTVFAEPHDLSVDLLVTEKRILTAK